MTQFTTKLDLYKPGGGSEGTNVPDEQADIDKLNDNFDIIDSAVGAEVVTSGTRPATPYDGKIIFETDTMRFRTWRQSNTTWEAGATSRGQLTQYLVADLTTLDAISDATLGDSAWMTTPGTGIDPLRWVAWAGTGSGIDWRPEGTVISDTKAHLDSFVSAVAAISDTRFQPGQLAFVTEALLMYRFVSDVGVLALLHGMIPIIPSGSPAVVGTGVSVNTTDHPGRVMLAAVAAGTISINNCFPDGIDDYLLICKGQMSAATTGGWTVRLRKAGSDDTTATNYDNTYSTSLAGAGSYTGQSSWGIAGGNSMQGGQRNSHVVELSLWGPGLATETKGLYVSNSKDATSNWLRTDGILDHRAATGYDSISFILNATGSGTVTGSIDIFGIVH